MWEHECMSFGESLVAGVPGFRRALQGVQRSSQDFQQNCEKSVSLKTPCWETGIAREESCLWQREWGGNSALLVSRSSCCMCNIPSSAPFWVTVLQLLQSYTESVRDRNRHFSARCRLGSLIQSDCAMLTHFYPAAGIQELNSYILSA